MLLWNLRDIHVGLETQSLVKSRRNGGIKNSKVVGVSKIKGDLKIFSLWDLNLGGTHNVNPRPLFAEGLNLEMVSIFRGGGEAGVAGEEGDDIFLEKGRCSFYIKNKLLSEILNSKKSL